jgi:hypothetical protein
MVILHITENYVFPRNRLKPSQPEISQTPLLIVSNSSKDHRRKNIIKTKCCYFAVSFILKFEMLSYVSQTVNLQLFWAPDKESGEGV